MPPMVVGLALVLLIPMLIAATPAAAGALDEVRALSVSVDLDHEVEGVEPGALRRRLTDALGDRFNGESADRLRLTSAVRPVSSSTLRGYALPFSGTYGIGTVRLSLERQVTLSGKQAPAIIWQRERQIATRWSASAEAIDRAVGELLDEIKAP